MASFVPINWKGHLYISVSDLCFESALGLLIKNRSDFREERIIVGKILCRLIQIFTWFLERLDETVYLVKFISRDFPICVDHV